MTQLLTEPDSPPIQDSKTIEDFRIPDIPPAAFYIPNFITEEEEAYLLERLESSPKPKWKAVGSGRRLQYWGGTMSKGGILLPEEIPEFFTTFPDLIGRLKQTLQKAGADGFAMEPNQVLVNEYQSGQGISPHEDGPAFEPLVATISLGSHTVLDIHHYISTTSPSPPMVAIPPSEGDEARPVAAVPLAHLLLLPRSLLIISASLYVSHLHAIGEKNEDAVRGRGTASENEVVIANAALLGEANIVDHLEQGHTWIRARGTRTSLTFRRALRVVKGGALGKAMGALRRP
ncbi:hypothetical protein I350_06032 [Cryptococcus amylolentus CBS 6273]|uniref:Fe2OG dioxygenase domain-containing protein n=1 Tax=Cryptococcus amylolentus CBS 6273 TaxID=1296118 RepID=A0A1E3JSW2_9TREE|nr:hypothetical protein I350_06032 [Cryptococcus amylolentus CBS 6273]